MFDISWGKLVLIGVVALIVIGPKELPTVLRTVGLWIGKVRRMAAEFQGQFQDAMREAEMADLKKTFDETTSSLNSVFDPIKTGMDNLVSDPMSAGSSSSASTAPATDVAATATDATPPADPVALGTAPAAPAAELSVPMPEMPPPIETRDFAATPAPDLAQAVAPGAPEAGGGKAA